MAIIASWKLQQIPRDCHVKYPDSGQFFIVLYRAHTLNENKFLVMFRTNPIYKIIWSCFGTLKLEAIQYSSETVLDRLIKSDRSSAQGFRCIQSHYAATDLDAYVHPIQFHLDSIGERIYFGS